MNGWQQAGVAAWRLGYMLSEAAVFIMQTLQILLPEAGSACRRLAWLYVSNTIFRLCEEAAVLAFSHVRQKLSYCLSQLA